MLRVRCTECLKSNTLYDLGLILQSNLVACATSSEKLKKTVLDYDIN
jgi:hypothetical protein